MNKALIIINVSKDESMTLAQEIAAYLSKKGVEHDFLSFDGFVDNTDFKGYDFVISLGGDGTVLYAARNASKYGIPVFPVNLGEFGFIASVQPDEWQKELKSFLNGKALFEKRSMLKVEVLREGKKVYSSLSLNDAVISAERGVSTIMLSVKRNSLPLCRLKADGLIVATPTGSTAYSLSNGGPIIVPGTKVFSMTAVAPHSMNIRPIVLSDSSEITLTVESRSHNFLVAIDGRSEKCKEGTKLTLRRASYDVKVVKRSRLSYFNTLREKMMWGIDTR